MKAEEAIDIIKRMYKGTPTTEQYEALKRHMKHWKSSFRRNLYLNGMLMAA